MIHVCVCNMSHLHCVYIKVFTRYLAPPTIVLCSRCSQKTLMNMLNENPCMCSYKPLDNMITDVMNIGTIAISELYTILKFLISDIHPLR